MARTNCCKVRDQLDTRRSVQEADTDTHITFPAIEVTTLEAGPAGWNNHSTVNCEIIANMSADPLLYVITSFNSESALESRDCGDVRYAPVLSERSRRK